LRTPGTRGSHWSLADGWWSLADGFAVPDLVSSSRILVAMVI
jgi:hypothetical protein